MQTVRSLESTYVLYYSLHQHRESHSVAKSREACRTGRALLLVDGFYQGLTGEE